MKDAHKTMYKLDNTNTEFNKQDILSNQCTRISLILYNIHVSIHAFKILLLLLFSTCLYNHQTLNIPNKLNYMSLAFEEHYLPYM